MKRLNIKLLSILAVVVVILAVGVHVVHGIQVNRNVDSLIKRAEEVKDSDPQTALLLYDRYRTTKPNDDERNADYAVLLANTVQSTLDERRFLPAVSALQDAMMHSENRPDLRHKLIDLNMTFHRYPAAKEDLERLKKNGDKDPQTD